MILALLPLLAPTALQASAAPDVAARFHAAYDARDEAACRALWSERPDRVLATLATDLDAALERAAAAEADGAVDSAPLLERALWGALRAEEALGATLLPEQVAAVAGWDADDRRNYKAEQDIHERAVVSLEQGDVDLALEAGQEAVVRAAALGDWWTTAQAHVLVGEAHNAHGAFDDALVSFSNARLLFNGLGVVDDEYRVLVRMAVVCNALEADERGLEASRRALALRERLAALGHAVPGDDHVVHLRVRAALQARTGDAAGAAETKAELEALETR